MPEYTKAEKSDIVSNLAGMAQRVLVEVVKTDVIVVPYVDNKGEYVGYLSIQFLYEPLPENMEKIPFNPTSTQD